MDELIFREAKGQLSTEDERKLAAWRAARPENEQRYRLTVAMLRRYGELERHDAVAEPPSIEEVIRPRRRFLVLGTSPPDGGRRRNRSVVAGSAAAAAVVILSVWGAGLWRATASTDSGTEDFFTGRAESAVIELRDGTVVRLGPDSHLMLSSREQRSVTLSGRAFFAVAKNPGRPFRIHTAAGALTVLGTRFDVEARERDLRVVVVEGRVALASTEGRSEISAGEMSRLIDGKQLPTVRVPDAARFVDWVGAFLAFQGTPLTDVAIEIERKYGLPVVISDTVLAKRTITAWFADRPLADVLRVVCLAAAAHCVVEDDVVRINGT